MNIHLNEIPQNIGRYVAIDSEWFGIEKLWRPTTGRFAMLQIATNSEDVYVYTDEQQAINAMHSIDNAVWIIHNAKFDIMHLRRLLPIKPRKKLVDTMLLERIMYAGYYDTFSLGALARRYLGIYVDKDERETFANKDGEVDEKKIQYAANDAIVLFKVWQEMKKRVDNNAVRIWRDVDLPALWAVLDIQGFRVNKEGWIALAEQNAAKRDEVDATLPFNPRSPTQVVPVLRAEGFKGIKDSNDKTLAKYLRKYPKTKAAELAKLIQESRMYGKRASSYGLKLIEDYLEDEGDGVYAIWDDWNVSAAETGRMCIDGDTILDTSMGQIAIRDIDIYCGKTYHIKTHKNRKQKITNKFYKGREMMYEVQTRGGGKIICTGNHRVLTPYGWRFVKNLSAGDVVYSDCDKN